MNVPSDVKVNLTPKINMYSVFRSTCHLFTGTSRTLLYQCLVRNNRRPHTRNLSSTKTPWREKNNSCFYNRCCSYRHVQGRSPTHPANNIVTEIWSSSPLRARSAKISGSFTKRWITRGGAVAWPLCLPDLSSQFRFLGAQIKTLMYETLLNLQNTSSPDIRPL